jgi:hypothetical protein
MIRRKNMENKYEITGTSNPAGNLRYEMDQLEEMNERTDQEENEILTDSGSGFLTILCC